MKFKITVYAVDADNQRVQRHYRVVIRDLHQAEDRAKAVAVSWARIDGFRHPVVTECEREED